MKKVIILALVALTVFAFTHQEKTAPGFVNHAQSVRM